jgi:hypothetical protein
LALVIEEPALYSSRDQHRGYPRSVGLKLAVFVLETQAVPARGTQAVAHPTALGSVVERGVRALTERPIYFV